ncbi:MAG: phosphoglycolate phosphatase [Betaproteobacteria bacterium]|nr:phosphoglycolate phosphatase [Betaproteobacteria bacterium]
MRFGGIKAVAFDLDGTLIDTLPDLAAAGNRMLQAMGRAPASEAQIRQFIGDGIAVLTRRLLTRHMDTEPGAREFAMALELFKAYYAEELAARSRPYPGVVNGLAALYPRFSLACVTNKALAYTHPLLAGTQLASYFRLVLGGDSLPRKKPEPEPFLHCAAYFGVEPGHLLVVGDSPNDCRAARAAGCPVVCVPYGYSGAGGVPALDCDAIVTDVFELAATLLNTHS